MSNPQCGSCNDTVLPIVDSLDCDFEIGFIASELQELFIAKATAAPFNDIEDEAEWIERLDNEGADIDNPDRIISFDIIGNIPKPTPITKQGTKFREAVITNEYKIPYRIIEITNLRYEAAKQFGCGGYYKYWVRTAGNYVYGGKKGFIGTNKIYIVLAEGKDASEVLDGEISFYKKYLPDRNKFPIAAASYSNDEDDLPKFTLQPSAQTIYAGATLHINTTVTGADTFQWKKLTNGTYINVSGQTAEDFNKPNAVTGDSGTYKLFATNDDGTTSSNPVVVTVNAALTFDTTFTFPASSPPDSADVTKSGFGITATIGSGDVGSDIQVWFNKIDNTIGDSHDMLITIGSTTRMLFTFDDEYTGQAFKFKYQGVTYAVDSIAEGAVVVHT